MRWLYLGLGIVLGVVIAGLSGNWRGTPALAQGMVPSSESSGTIAFSTPIQGGGTLLFLVDTRDKAFAVYRVDALKGSVKLEASRPYRYDLKLEFNNLPPEVAAVEAMVATTTRK
jgi:hypothetical protein